MATLALRAAEGRDDQVDPLSVTEYESHMFVATAAPRFTLGQKTFRMWVAVGGGLVMYVGAFNGSAGIDLHVFTKGGLSIAGAYTRSFNDSPYDYFAAAAGLGFTL